VEVHHSLGIVWPEAPHTAEGWVKADQSRDPKCKFRRWVGMLDGQVVGIGGYSQNLYDYHPQRFNIFIEVSPNYQRQGTGGALYERARQGLAPFHPRVLRADSFTNLPQGFRFLEKRGFYEAFRETPVQLNVPAFDPVPYSDLEARVTASDIHIKTLAELAGDPDRDHKLFELFWQVAKDVPHEEAQVHRPNFEEWVRWGVYDPVILQDGYFLAVQGDEYVGLREMGVEPGSQVLISGLLGVRQGFRRQGIALALELRAIGYAAEHGYPLLKTCTAAVNAPMQALFDKLGYDRSPEWLQCQKDL
jgi:GNAT superfamily N-acetyltransferase